MSRIILTFVVTALLLGNAVSQEKSRASALNEATLKAHIKFLADDLLEGRGTGARGGELAAKYIAAQLEAVGAKGAGENGSFFQPVSLVGVKADPATVLTISINAPEQKWNDHKRLRSHDSIREASSRKNLSHKKAQKAQIRKES